LHEVDENGTLVANLMAANSFEMKKIGAAYALAGCGKEGYDILNSCFHRKEESVSKCAVYGLIAAGKISVEQFIQDLHETKESIRLRAQFGLGEIRAHTAVPALIASYAEEKYNKYSILEALGTLCGKDIKDKQILFNTLFEGLKDKQPQARFQACFSLIKLADMAPEETVSKLEEVLRDENRYVRAYALKALEKIGSPEAIKILLEELWTSRYCTLTSPESPY